MAEERREDTEPSINVLELIHEALTEIKTELVWIKERLTRLEERGEERDDRMRDLIADVNLVHELQKSFSQRMGFIEGLCVEGPLRSTPLPLPLKGVGDAKR